MTIGLGSQLRVAAVGFSPTVVQGFDSWLDTTQGKTLDSGLSVWDPRVGATVMTQTTPADRPAVSGDSPPWVQCTSDNMVTTRPKSGLNRLHNGTGGTLVFVGRPRDVTTAVTAYPISTGVVTTDVGFRCLTLNSAPDLLRFDTLNGSGSAAATATMGDSMVANRAYIVAMRLDSAGLKAQWTDELGTTSTATDSSVSTPSVADSAAFLRFGDREGGGNAASWDFGDILTYSAFLSDADLARVVAFLGEKWGFA
jgi:hypothetical protein